MEKKFSIRIDKEIQAYLDKYPYGSKSEILRARIKNVVKSEDVPTRLNDALNDYDLHLITREEFIQMYYAAVKFVNDIAVINIIKNEPELEQNTRLDQY